MCGIQLIFDKKRQLPPQQAIAMQKMLEAGSHRGPDAEDAASFSFGGGRIHLGSNRLKIIDPHPRANQPMLSADGRYSLCFNGTIYNYFELRNQLLGQGIQFTTQSDTEVLLHMLIRHGHEALDKLNGMFALAFYDVQAEKLLIARDRFGIKPLYYFQNEDYLLFSSQIKSLTNCGLLAKKLRPAAIHEYLAFRYAHPPRTFFENIFQFPAGHYLEIGAAGHGEPRPFVGRNEQQEIPEAEVLREVEERLTDAVLRHLVADVNSGLFLSGGVDSTLLLALIHEQGAHPIPTFSVINSKEDAAYGTHDYQYAASAAAMYGRKHYELALSADMLPKHAPSFISSVDQPVGDSAAFLTYMLSAEVKKVAGIALSGAGADELFGGYHRHQAFQMYLRYYRAFIKSAALIRKTSQILPTGFRHPLQEQFRLLAKLGKSLHNNPAQTFRNFIGREIFSSSLQLTDEGASSDQNNFESYWLEYAFAHDLHNYLPQDILLLSDNMSMARSLEMRLPYLDQALASYALKLPASLKLRHGRKWILKRLLEKRGGKAFSRRAKAGFGLPLGHWLRTEACQSVRSRLETRDSLLYEHIAYEQVAQMLKAHQARRADHGIDLWNLWQLSAWLEVNFG